ncbi:type II toxin-antitoxin system VapC family toxin [Rhizobium sp. WYCCWR 11279]|uniref:type II toxin-antitoxin system VapC family toxin n=1 Tax=Rhizobium changzhiense TaxID=2692317 RepID=UPI001492EE79|nr:type II toxin-antitoxin system VapC family toxin [Rhizobium changzhiense]NNU49684.1 type II toxin-antitoxin system VapC family toxin [Rhizobium changzhiense]
MFIDASAIVAILAREPGHEELEKTLAASDDPTMHISPLVRFEAILALARQKTPTGRKTTPELLKASAEAVDAFAEDLILEEISISHEIGEDALSASMHYGKVIGHPADLNFGDCFAYACATALKTRLLYKGNDFLHTDLA